MMYVENSELFKSLKKIYFFGGIWTDRDDAFSKIYFKSTQIIYIAVIMYMLMSLHSIIKLFNENLDMFGLGMLISMSAFLDFLRFLQMKKPQFQSIVSEIFNDEKLFFQTLKEASKKCYHETSRGISNLVFFYKISVTFSVFTVICLTASVITKYLRDPEGKEHIWVYKKYIVEVVHVPFSVSENYVLSHAYINIFIYFSSFMVCMIDVAFLVPIWYMRLKLKILGVEIESVLDCFPGNSWNVDASREIVCFVRQHQRIIERFDRIKTQYWNILFVTTIFYGIQFAPGFLGLLYFENMNFDLIIQLGGLCYTFSQLFILHWQSQLLTDESVRIGDQIFFGCEWYRMNPKSRKLLLMMLIRTQKPLELACGPLYPLNLAVFLQVLKRLYTFINIFKEMR